MKDNISDLITEDSFPRPEPTVESTDKTNEAWNRFLVVVQHIWYFYLLPTFALIKSGLDDIRNKLKTPPEGAPFGPDEDKE